MNQRMREYLDAPVNRIGTHCEKWDHMEETFGRNDLIAMWVADMDFPTAPAVRDALVARAEHAIYGYTDNGVQERQAEVDWLMRRHGLKVLPEWILYSPSVVDSIFFCVRALTDAHDKILIQPPVYGPFYRAVEIFDRELVKNPLVQDANGVWRMDFEGMEAKFAEGVKMMILCSPHNPVGRVWQRAELERLLELANRYSVILVSDEIHSEFVFDGHRQTRILSLENSENCILLTSATKSFNLAGLRQSSMIIPDGRLREEVLAEMTRANATTPNLFGGIAQTAAYCHGDEWMDAVVEYVRENRDFAVQYIREYLPEIGCRPQEGTYLMWLDFRGLKMEHEAAFDLLVNQARVALNSGLSYGEEGRGYFRMNLATQRANVVATLENIRKAIRGK